LRNEISQILFDVQVSVKLILNFGQSFEKFVVELLRMISKATVIGSRWSVDSLLGEGACAKVYSVSDLKNASNTQFVIKVIPLATGKGKKAKDLERICNTLHHENTLYIGLLLDFPFCPKLPERNFYGNDELLAVRYLVIERLDMDLSNYAEKFNPSPSAIANCGLQILEGLEWLHKKYFLFIDVKPQNFMLKGNKLYFVDCKYTKLFH
jgi:serine/threonine protein kinase